MKRFLKSISSLLLIVAMLVSVFSVFPAYVGAATVSGTGYDSADDVKYVYSGDYIANWGAREEDCVFLSTYAQSFYTGNNTYSVMSQISGGSSQSNADDSALYSALKSFMTSNHDYQTSYNATKDLYKYTDCTLSNYSKISSFYSGNTLSGSWDGSWNREHTWPNSKGLGGNDENDIMMLRPTSVSENSSRGNTAYGESSSYYDPNKESKGAHDLHGDVARIALYVFVRWGNTSYMWGQSGVIENLDVLLKWMEEDPVDTWEMGRNDAVQSITGTRNVFVDYPEYAWLLFGRSIPSDMVTPSGIASNGTAGGNTGGVTTAPETEAPAEPETTATPNVPVVPGSTVTNSYVFANYTAGTQYADEVHKLDDYLSISTHNKGCHFTEQLRIYQSSSNDGWAILTLADGYTFGSLTINAGYKAAHLQIYGSNDGDAWTLVDDLTVASSYKNFAVDATGYSMLKLDALSNQVRVASITADISVVSDENDTEAPTEPDTEAPTEPETEAPTEPAPDTTEPETEAPAEPGDGVEVEATLSFDSTDNRTAFSTSQQVWEQNGIILTNNKGNSTSNVGDYSNPARFYKNTDIIIEADGLITKIEFTCNTAAYATALAGVIDGATADEKTVTVTFATPVDSLTATLSGGQIRMNSLTVTYLANGNAGGDDTDTETETEPETETPTEPEPEPEYVEVGLDEAVKLEDGAKVIVKGTVVEINTPYSDAFGNITLTIADDKGNTLYVYRLKGNWAIGDILTVTGTMTTYNGNRQIAQGATAVKTGEAEVEGPDYNNVSIPEAVLLPDDSWVIVVGTVASIDGEWSDSYGNMNVTISDAEGNTLYIYRLTTKVSLGDTVIITGKMATYKEARQVIQGTAEIVAVGPTTEIKQASVTINTSLHLLAHISLANGENISDYVVKFIHENGAEEIVTAYTELNGQYIFALDKIAPQAMGDLITIQLLKDGEVVDELENYSIKQYAQTLLLGDFDAEIKALASDLLAYGAAAQKHTGYKINDLVTDGVKGLVFSEATPDALDNVNTGKQNAAKVDGLGFTSVGVRFDCNVSIYAKFTAASLDNINVTVNGEQAQILALGNGTYIVYSDNLYATEFGNTHVIVLEYNGVAYQTLTYSVNSYAAAKYASSELALTLYRYGMSALALAQ